MATPQGDTPRTDKEPALVDDSGTTHFTPQGDKVKAGYVSEVEVPPAPKLDGPTGDTPGKPGSPAHLVENFGTPEDDDSRTLTPNEWAKKHGTKAVNAAPKNKSAASDVKNK